MVVVYCEREVARMNYVCVSMNKEVVNKETFSNKEQAVLHFQTLLGEKIREEKEGLKCRAENSILICEKQIQKEIQKKLMLEKKAEQGELEIPWNFYDDWQAKVDNLHEKKKKKEAELKQLHLDMQKREVAYENKYNGYKNNLFSPEPQLILHIAGIYQNGYQFTVVEEKYYVNVAKIEGEKSSHSVLKKLPSQFDKNRISLYLFREIEHELEVVEADNQERVQKTVSHIRNQILRNFQTSQNRLKEV